MPYRIFVNIANAIMLLQVLLPIQKVEKNVDKLWKMLVYGVETKQATKERGSTG